MSSASTIILVPFLLAFLAFVVRFYTKDGAHSMLRPSFLLAFATTFIAAAYLFLGVMKLLPEYGTTGFLLVGLVLLALSIYRMFII